MPGSPAGGTMAPNGLAGPNGSWPGEGGADLPAGRRPADARTFEKDDKTVRNLWRLEQHNEFFRALGLRPD
ncbi:MAG TPA: hypothetical protein DIT13_03565, partial [Verrucomicrobiales bacterium]|nr:hypothetical protein [Verrucomicrobiales bacterium]